MRTGIVVDGRTAGGRAGGAADGTVGGTAGGMATGLGALAARVEDLGFDVLWLRADDRLLDPFVLAPFAAAATTGLRIGVEVPVGDRHPIPVAEAATVCDLSIGGRLLLGLRPDDGVDESGFAAAVEVVLRSHRSRPFRIDDGPWRIPAGLAANEFQRDDTVVVTPAPAQVELPTWVVGAPDVATRLGVAAVVADVTTGAGHWGPRDDADPTAWRLTRPGVVAVPGGADAVDHQRLVDDLQAAVTDWGMDLALFDLPPVDEADDGGGVGGGSHAPGWSGVLDGLARIVAPRVQQPHLPAGLVAWWDDELGLGDVVPDEDVVTAGEAATERDDS